MRYDDHTQHPEPDPDWQPHPPIRPRRRIWPWAVLVAALLVLLFFFLDTGGDDDDDGEDDPQSYRGTFSHVSGPPIQPAGMIYLRQ